MVFFRRLGRILWWGFTTVIIGLAVALSAARLLLPGMAEHLEQVEGLVGDVLHRPVEIGSMDAAWYRLSPVLRLQQVVIYDESFPDGRLEVGEVQVGLNIVDSLWRQRWLTSGIRIIGVQLALHTDLSSKQTDDVGMDAFYWLMRQESVSLEQITLDWQDPGLFDQPVLFSGLSAQLKNNGWRHQLLVQADVNEHYGKQIELAADLHGPLKRPRDWRGKVYLRTEGFRLSSVSGLTEAQGYTAEGDVDLEVWASIRSRELKWSAGSIYITQPQLSRRDGSKISFGADALSSHFSLRAIENGWTVELQEFSLLRDQVEVWPETRLRATLRNGESLSAHGRISHVAISEAGSMLPLLPWIDGEMRHRIEHMQPRGELTDTEFDLYLHDDAPPDLSIRSSFDHLGIMANDGLPGVTGLSGRLKGNLQTGSIDIDSQTINLQLPGVFSTTPAISRLTGLLRWERLTDRFRITSDQLLLVSGSLSTQTRLQLDWLPGQPVPWVDMQLQADGLPATDAKRYIPDKVMRPKALKWTRNAFRRGNLRDVRFLLQGPLNHVPFDQGDGRLEVRFDFDDMLLDFHPLWGQLDALQGSALFVGRSMRITGTSATILDANMDRAVAVIEDFSNPVLDVKGTVNGTLESLLAYINYSPLRDRFGLLVDRTTTRGDADLQLDLRIPLRAALGKLEVQGKVRFHGNSLKAIDSDMPLEDVNGFLNFTGQGVTAKDISAKLFKHPVKVSVYPGGSTETGGTTVDIEGRLGLVSMLEKEFPHIAPFVDGSAYWHALLRIPAWTNATRRPVELEVHSDLKGVMTELPAPFAKTPEDVRTISISWMPGQLSTDPLVVKLGSDISLQLLMRGVGGGVRKANLHFGEGDASLLLADTVYIDGLLDVLSLDAWVDLLRDIAGSEVASAGVVPPVSTDLHIRQVDFLGYTAQDLNFSSRAEDPWRLAISGRDMSGQASWTSAVDDGVPMLTLRLEQLTAVKMQKDTLAEKRAALTPEGLPNLDLEIGRLQLGTYKFGRITVRGERVGEGVSFTMLQADSKAIAFKGQGEWLQQGEQQSSRFRADITGGELGKLVKMFGDLGSIQGGKMRGHASLDWPGNPADFSLTSLEGKIRLKTGKGRLVEVKAGAAKLLNLVNLNSLQRRLSLDFTDLTKEGFSFDKMKGTFVISDGNAYTENFVIEGSSATIEISGRTGLAARDYDQLVKVTPQVSSSLPLAGVIAGGPAVGAAVFLAERLVGKSFNRMAQVRYKVAGSWENPVYTRLKPEPEPDQHADEESP